MKKLIHKNAYRFLQAITFRLCRPAMAAVLIAFGAGAVLAADTVSQTIFSPSSQSHRGSVVTGRAGAGFDGGAFRLRIEPSRQQQPFTDGFLPSLPQKPPAALAAGSGNDAPYRQWLTPLLPEAGADKNLRPDFVSSLLPIFVIMAILGLWFMKREIDRKTRYLVEENRERRQIEQALRRSEKRYRQAAEEIRSQNETENILSSLTALLLTETKLEDISDLVLETAKKLTTSRYGFVGSIHPDNGFLCSHTMTRDIWKECNIPDKTVVFKEYTGLWGWALKNRRPILVNDATNDPRAAGTPPGHIAIEAFLGVPAVIGEEPAGMIALANPGRPYDDTDMAVVLRLATIYAMALQRHHWEKALLEAEMEKSADLEKLVQVRTAELCESREALRTLADFTYDWEIWVSPDGHLLYTSPSCERITGYAPEDFINDPSILVDITHPEDRARLCRHLNEEHSQQTVQKIDFRLIDRDGELRWISHHCQPVYSKNGEYLGRRGSNRDITERKRNEERLAESQERLTLALDSVSDAVWDWRLDTGEMYFSSRYYTMLGYEPYEMPPSYETWAGLLHEDDLAAAEHCVSTHLTSGEPFEIEFRLRTRDNQWKFVLARGKTVEWDAQGTPLRMLGTHMDISERKRIEEQMQQVQKMEAIGTLAGGIAHDFNNILGAIIGHGELLQRFKSCDDREVDEGLKQILRAAYRASDLVQQILFFSRKNKVQAIDLHVTPIVKEVLKMIRASLPSTIDIEQELDIPDGTVVADATQMHQVLMNLCTNAGHAMREEGGTLAVRLRVVDGEQAGCIDCSSKKAGHLLILEVSDTGPGIDREILPQIFEPYFTTKRKGEGTGLGLSIVYGIIQNWGGRIAVDSHPHVGTTFTVSLPFTPGTSEQMQSVCGTIIEGSGRVLFVDDEEVLVDYAEMLFTKIGYQAVTTTNSLEALEIFRSAPDDFDIIITDLTMPRLTGLELCQEIRKTSAEIPVILCSGNFDQSDEPAARRAGITAFVAKPFRIKTLAEVMDRLSAAHSRKISV